jgi:hypothetical protein
MRSYGKKRIKGLVDDRVSNRREMQDAILWSIEGSVCRVRIQGSSTNVIAHYPRNQKKAPLWLRPGNAVRVVFKEGIRGYVEIVGEGRAIPSAQSGGSLPGPGSISDGILSGLVVTATIPVSNNVEVSAGSYRINGVIYYMTEVSGGYIVMDDPPPMVMGDLPFVLNGQVSYELPAAPAEGWFRYDIIVAGTDGDLDLIEGVAVTSDPVIPSVPVDHVLVVHILRVGGDTAVPMKRIGALYETPYPVLLSIPENLLIYHGTSTVGFPVSVLDQYDHAVSSSSGWVMTLTKIFGTGDIWSSRSGWDSGEVVQNLVSQSVYSFIYRRDYGVEEHSPFLQVVMTGGKSPLYGFAGISLKNLLGEHIP